MGDCIMKMPFLCCGMAAALEGILLAILLVAFVAIG